MIYNYSIGYRWQDGAKAWVNENAVGPWMYDGLFHCFRFVLLEDVVKYKLKYG